MNLSQKVAVVSGGSSGLGEAIVQSLLKLGCQVAILDIQAPKIENKKQLYIETDIRSEEAVANAIEITFKTFGAIHFNINCAGIA